MTAKPDLIFVNDSNNDASVVKLVELIEQNDVDTSAVLAGAIERNLNVVISKKPGYGIVTSTLEQLREIGKQVEVVDASRMDVVSLLLNPLDQDAEVIVFDELHSANDSIKNAVVEIMHNRSMKGIEFPKLKSVVVFLNGGDNKDSAQFTNVAPSISMEWR